MPNVFPLLQNSTWKKKSNVNEQGNHSFQYVNYAQITSKQFHLLFVHNDNRSNKGQIGQVIAMQGSGKNQDFYLCLI
jgi:hypothetical protein